MCPQISPVQLLPLHLRRTACIGWLKSIENVAQVLGGLVFLRNVRRIIGSSCNAISLASKAFNMGSTCFQYHSFQVILSIARTYIRLMQQSSKPQNNARNAGSKGYKCCVLPQSYIGCIITQGCYKGANCAFFAILRVLCTKAHLNVIKPYFNFDKCV